MARANRTGVPGLTQIKSGPRAGSYMLGYRYLCPVTRQKDIVTKLYPATMKTAAIKADAMGLIKDAHSGELYRRKHAEKASEAKKTIATIAPEVTRFREEEGGSVATLHEFKSIVSGIERLGRKSTGGHVVRHLGPLAPHELDSAKLAAFVDTLRKGGASPLTIRNVMKVLGQFLKIAKVRKLDPELRGNPVREALEEGLSLPSKRRELPVFVTQGDAEKLLACRDVPQARRVRYALAFLSGLRDGEIAGLTWGDVDLDTNGAELLHIRRAYAYRGGLQAPKTAAGLRDVPLHTQAAAWLRVWRSAGWSALVGRDHKPEDAVFPLAPPVKGPGAKARHARPDSARRLRRDFALAKIEVSEAVDFHATRRSFATWLEAAGVPHETIERLMGHEPKSVLGRHYAAPDIGVLREAVSRLSLTVAVRLQAVS